MATRNFRLGDVMIQIHSQKPISNKEVRSLLMKLAQSESTKDPIDKIFYFTNIECGIKPSSVSFTQDHYGNDIATWGDGYYCPIETFNDRVKSNKPMYLGGSDNEFIIIGTSEESVREAAMNLIFKL